MRLRLPFNQTPFLWALLLGFSYLLKLIFGISLPLITFDLVAISWLITSMWVALSDEYSSYIESSKNAFWLVSIITFIVVFPYFIFRVFLNSFYAVKARYVKIVKVVKKYIPYCKYFFPFCYSVLLVFWEVFIELLLFFTLCLTEFVTNFVKFLSKILSYAPGSDSYSTWYVTIILLLIFMLVNPIYFLLSGTLLRAFWYIIEECGYLRDFRLLIFIFIFVLSIAGYSPTYYCITSFTEWSLECIDTLEDALTSLKDILHLQLLRDNIPAIVQYKLSVMLHDSIPTHIEYKPLPLSWHWDIPHWYEGLTKLFYTYHNICGPLGVTYTDNMSNWNRYFVWALTGIKYWEGFDDLPAQVPAALEAEVALTWEDTFLDFDWHFADEQLLASVSNKLFGLFKEPIHPSNWNICPCDDLFSKFRT